MGERIRRIVLRVGGVMLATCAAVLVVPAPARGATPEEVEAAIAGGKKFLYSRQKDGNWEDITTWKVTDHHYGGLTAIATYALLAAGESAQDARLVAAIKFLKESDIHGAYAAGLRAQVWTLIPQDDSVKKLIESDGRMFEKAALNAPRGLNHYDLTAPDKSYDLSTSQYAVLGMWACVQAGYKPGAKYWEYVDQAWKEQQLLDGGWTYHIDPNMPSPAKASMTAAGIATLFITQDYVNPALGADPRGNMRTKEIEAGLKWMAKNFKQVGGHYTWYGIERIGVASGIKYFGATDWYQVGAETLVRGQNKETGSFGDQWGEIPATSFAMVFLVRGRAPVVFNKLQYEVVNADGKESFGLWNQRPRDAANVVKWAGRQLEKDLNWQIVNLKVEARDLHDAPILYISGMQELRLSEDIAAKLKNFVEQGGLILGNADGGSEEFAKSFMELGKKLFPKYAFRELPANHPIYVEEQYPAKIWKNPPGVMGMSNGSRELMLLIPKEDVAKYWQLNVVERRPEMFQLAADIFLYAVDKQNLLYKGQTYIVTPEPAVVPTGKLSVARIEYDGNWDPEPGGWRRLAALLHNNYKVEMTVEAVKLGGGKIGRYRVAHLTGTEAFTFTAEQRKELAHYVEVGGTLIIDAAGGSGEFAMAAERELQAMFPEAIGQGGQLHRNIPLGDRLYSANGIKLAEVGYRTFARKTLAGSTAGSHLRAIEIKGRRAVFFSAEDLSTGLVGQQVDGVVGYDPRSATMLMEDMLLTAGNLGPATRPAPPAPPSATLPSPSSQPAGK